jgi:membrane-bound lytic murein transglycosylase C
VKKQMANTRSWVVFFNALISWAALAFLPGAALCEDTGSKHGFYHEQKAMENEWNAMASGAQRAWSDIRKAAEHNWAAYVQSTHKDWVSYDRAMQTRSRVDFENGRIEIETVLPDDDTATIDAAAEKLAASAEAMLSKTLAADQTILHDQIKDKSGQPVNPETASAYFIKELAPRISKDPTPYIAKDGSRKTRYSVSIDMVPDHIDIRARQYLPIVAANAERFNLDPKLILAIIHTESYFNPLAQSSAGAVGLMQIIPKYAGREAYAYLYGQDWTIDADYLYSPGVNIELGSAYLHLLMNTYFGHLGDLDKRRFVSICAYNWGPTSVRNKILDRGGATEMDAPALYRLLREKTPQETREYLKKVTERMALYAPYFGS